MFLLALNDSEIDISATEDDTLTNEDDMLNFFYRNPNPKTHYKRSDTILRTHSDGSYLYAP